ncbi:MAG: hypothetical protein R3C40_10040 [Parvularculaceae bacterium]
MYVTGLREAGLPAGVVQFISSPDRALVKDRFAGINGAVDLVICAAANRWWRVYRPMRACRCSAI